jgi:hypothetical protein
MYIGKGKALEWFLNSKEKIKTTGTVLKLSGPLLQKGHTLWMDNYYNSPYMAKFLKSCNINYMGTLKLSRNKYLRK